MDEMGLHQEHAKKLLSEAGASLTGESAEDLDPTIAYAQAATKAAERLKNPQMMVSPGAAYATANPMPGAMAPVDQFIAQQNHNPPMEQPPAMVGPPAPEPVAGGTPGGLGAPVGPTGPMAAANPTLPNNMIMGPADLAVESARNRDRALSYNAKDTKNTGNLLREQAILDSEQAAAEQPVIDSMAKQSQESFARLQTQTDAINKQSEARIQHYEGVQKELETMAAEQPKDLLGQAGVNSILGNLAIFFGGAGVNGFHENQALKQFESMADRNLAAQRNKFEMLQKVGQGDQTMFGMLQNKLQNTVAVEAALRGAYADVYASNMKQVAGQYSDKRTQQKLQAGLEKVEEYKHTQILSVHEKFMAESTKAIELAGVQQQQLLNAQAAQHTAALADAKFGLDMDTERYKRENELRQNRFLGLIGASKPEEHAKLAEIWGGARNMVANLDDAILMMKADKSWANGRGFQALKNINLGEAKKYFNTGARLEPKEVQMMESVGISWKHFVEAYWNGGQGKNGDLTNTQIEAGMHIIQGLLARNAFGTIQAGAPEIQYDRSDPLMGRFAPEEYKPEYAEQAKRNYGPQKGRDSVNTLPDYTAALAGSGD